MHKLRIFLCWMFAFTSPVCVIAAAWSILHRIHRHHAFSTFRILVFASLFAALAAVFGVAWWTIWKRKPGARIWGVSASLVYLSFSLWEIIHFSRPVWSDFGGMLAVGIAGFVAFSWPGGPPLTQPDK